MSIANRMPELFEMDPKDSDDMEQAAASLFSPPDDEEPEPHKPDELTEPIPF